jgi:hypothetical protein
MSNSLSLPLIRIWNVTCVPVLGILHNLIGEREIYFFFTVEARSNNRQQMPLEQKSERLIAKNIPTRKTGATQN